LRRLVLGIGGIVLATTLFAGEIKSIPSWYYKIKNITKQKEKFFEILRPLVKKENLKIKREREFVKEFFDNYYKTPIIDEKKLQKLVSLAKKYRIKNIYNKEKYLIKIDAIPESLVLAQAALESGWGKSRFARVANNLFGEWTFGKKGIIPQNRAEGKNHKIRIFDSISDSIASYMLNLNRHRAYKEFRMARFEAKKAGKSFSGLKAAMTMQRYSEIGKRYNRLVSSIIRKNRLHLNES